MRARPPVSAAGRADRLANERVDLGFPVAAAEHAVVADAGLHVAAAAFACDRAAEHVGRGGLPERGDIVLRALDREQRQVRDRVQLDALTAPLEASEPEVVAQED